MLVKVATDGLKLLHCTLVHWLFLAYIPYFQIGGCTIIILIFITIITIIFMLVMFFHHYSAQPPCYRWRSVEIHTGVLCNVGYPSKCHLKLKYHESLLSLNNNFNYAIGLKFYTKHGNDIAVHHAKHRNY